MSKHFSIVLSADGSHIDVWQYRPDRLTHLVSAARSVLPLGTVIREIRFVHPRAKIDVFRPGETFSR